MRNSLVMESNISRDNYAKGWASPKFRHKKKSGITGFKYTSNHQKRSSSTSGTIFTEPFSTTLRMIANRFARWKIQKPMILRV